MLWDIVILLSAFCLALTGWNTGLVNSWRGPIAMAIATIASQHFYVDFATWLVQQILIVPDKAALLSYFVIWVSVEITSELLLNLLVQWNRKKQPAILNRLSGLVFGLFKCAAAVILPLMCMQSPSQIPSPPAAEEKATTANNFLLSMADSRAINAGSDLAKQLLPGLGSLTTNDNPPSFKPKFAPARPKVQPESSDQGTQ